VIESVQVVVVCKTGGGVIECAGVISFCCGSVPQRALVN
jgi:hypothetical protein